MGFQIGRTFVLDFGEEGETDLYGAVVKMRSGNIGTFKQLVGNGDVDLLHRVLAEHVIEWNLELDGVPLPVEPDSFLKLDSPARDLIHLEWVKATRGISAPFDRRSDGGDSSPTEEPEEQSIPMEPL